MWLPLAASAHNPDTSYTRITISPDRIDFKFTFDVYTLFKITNLDDNQDHQVTRAELLKHTPLIEKYIQDHIKIDLDDRALEFGPSDPPVFSEKVLSVEEKDYHQALVHFVFHHEVITVPEAISIDYKVFTTLGDRHTILASVEEGDATKEEIVFTQFEPDYDYYTNTTTEMSRQLMQFLKLGIKHIFLGYDHVLFLLALIVVSRFGKLLKIITAFTVAHSLTLILAALGFIHLPMRVVETGIAVTIMYVALENIFAKNTAHRWRLTFCFGLVHGMSFANVLNNMGLPTTGLVRSLVTFNIGVEIGQIVIVLVLLPFAVWLAKQPFERPAKVALSSVIFLCGLAWFIERAFGVRFMPV